MGSKGLMLQQNKLFLMHLTSAVTGRRKLLFLML